MRIKKHRGCPTKGKSPSLVALVARSELHIDISRPIYEAHISTQYPPSEKEARLSQSYEYPSRPSSAEEPPRKGPSSPVRLIGRIHERTILDRIAAEGKRVRSGSLWCSVVIDQSVPNANLAYAVGKRSGSAVVRNRIRRRLRAQFAALDSQLPTGYYLVGGAGEVATMKAATLTQQVKELVRKIQQVGPNA